MFDNQVVSDGWDPQRRTVFGEHFNYHFLGFQHKSVPLAEIRRARERLPPCQGEVARAVYDSLDGWFFDGSWDFKRLCLRGTDMMWTTAFLT